MAEVLQQLQLSVGAFGQDRSAEGLHDLLNGDWLAGQLVAGGARWRGIAVSKESGVGAFKETLPDQAKGAHAHRLQIRVPRNHVSIITSPRRATELSIPAGNLEGGAEDLGPHKFRHGG